MKIGIITFHAVHNYGAVLQAYGLQEYLRNIGHDVFIIDYRPEYLQERYKCISFKRIMENKGLARLKFCIRELLVYPVRKRRKAFFDRFVHRMLRLQSFNDLSVNNDFDVFFFGSDQIWNPMICQGFDPVFFGCFPGASNKQLVAYAGSIGSLKNFNEQQKVTFLKSLQPFSAISCREKEPADFIETELGRAVATVLDPVLLAGRSVFEKIATPIRKTRYLLLFTLGNNDKTSEIAYKIAKEKGLDVVEIVSYQISLAKRSAKQAVSVRDFLGYLRYADFVVTSSFHGTALSVLFGKELYFVPDDPRTGERSMNLLHTLGISDRVWSDVVSSNPQSINYKSVFDRLDVERERSIDFIASALNK